MISILAFGLGVITIVLWYVWQDFTRPKDTSGYPRTYGDTGPEVYSLHNERPPRPCPCGALSQMLRAYVEMNRSPLKQFLIGYLKKELCRSINHSFNGYVDLRLIHLSMGTHIPQILSIRRVPDNEFCISAEVEYLGATSALVRLSLPFVEKCFGVETKIKIEFAVEKLTFDALLTLSTHPYPHVRLSLKNMPRWFIRKKIFTPGGDEVHSKLLTWFVDFSISTTIRSKLIHPIFIMNDRLYPFEWRMLQIQEAVYQEDTFLELTFDRLFRTSHKKNMFLVTTIEPSPWIHMDLVNLTPIAYFTLVLKKKNSFYPGLILGEKNNADIATEICHPSVTVRSILPDGAAEDALLLEGDVIIAVDGVKVCSAQRTVELLDAAKQRAVVRVQREVHFKWSRKSHTMVPTVEWLSKSDLDDIFPYPQSRSTKNRNFDAVLGTPDEIITHAEENGYQFMMTSEFDLAGGIDRSLRIPSSRKNMYISFGIWTGSDIVGYGSMLLNSCVGWCQETSGELVLRLPLGHPDDMRTSSLPNCLRAFRDVPGFNIRLTHGEIVMRLRIVNENGS